MNIADLTRKVKIDMYASGHVHVRAGTRAKAGTLPVYSCASVKEAKSLIVFACVLSRVRGEGYAVPGLSGDPDDLQNMERAAERFRTSHATLKERTAKRASIR